MTAVCVVTGAAGGMGSACARSMGSSVDALLLTDRDESRLELVAEQISGESKAQVSVMAGDIADPEFACELSRRAAADGHLHSLVHTAGLSPSMADWQEILRLEFDDVSIRGDQIHGIIEEQAAQIRHKGRRRSRKVRYLGIS